MQNFLEPFGAAMVILQESIKVLPKIGKLIDLKTIVPNLILFSITFLVGNFSYKSLLLDMLLRESFIPLTSSNSGEFSTVLARPKEDFGLMLAVDVTFILYCSFINLFSITATILVSAISHTERTLSNRDFSLLVIRSWKKPLITGFYTTLLDIGYIFFVLAISSPVIMMFSGNTMASALGTAFVVWILGYIWYLYLSIVWVLSIVISVIEENCYGLEAIGKARRLIQGKKISGYILNILSVLLSVIIFQGFRIIRGHKWLVNDTIFGLILLNFSYLVKLFHFVSYTVLYFHCKKHHGEEIELQGVEYTKLSAIPLVNDMA